MTTTLKRYSKQKRQATAKPRNFVVHMVFTVICFLLILFSLLIILMLLWAFLTSIKTYNDLKFDNNELFGLPNFKKYGFSSLWENYVDVIKHFSFNATEEYYTATGYHYIREVEASILTMAINSIIYAGFGAVFMTFVPAICAYVLAKYKFKFSKILYGVALITYIIPIVGNYPSMIHTLEQLGLLDTWPGFFIMKFNFLGMYFFVFYSFFEGINDSYIEAAELDGASQVQILFQIILPLARKMLLSVLLICFVQLWNDFQTPNLYLQTHPTLAYGVWRMTNMSVTGATKLNQRMASVMTMGLPIILLFIVLKDKLMANVTMGGIKD